MAILHKDRRRVARQRAGSNDIDNLAQAVKGVDPRRYFDRQSEDAWRDAAQRWPMLAALLGIESATAVPGDAVESADESGGRSQA